ncbi:MAG: hypothetical protein ACYTX0_56440, partial [Nostoc sp.]
IYRQLVLTALATAIPRGMRITSGIDFLLCKNKFWMDDESPGFSGKVITLLTLRVQNRSLFA